MKLGFFGDSYANMVWHKMPGQDVARNLKPWSYRLLDDFNSPIIASGKGGASLFYAIDTWMQHLDSAHGICDVAVFTLTWEDRLYSEKEQVQNIMCAEAEYQNSQDRDQNFVNSVQQAITSYRTFIHSKKQTRFIYELMTQWILNLPNQYQQTKFIFLPNTEFARQISLKNFSKGVLVNFTFESLSNLETASPGPMPINCGRIGHLNTVNHEAFTNLMKSIINNYSAYENTILNPDFGEFDLTTSPKFC